MSSVKNRLVVLGLATFVGLNLLSNLGVAGFNYFSANAIQRFFYVQLEKKF
jgi:hypothetical protein